MLALSPIVVGHAAACQTVLTHNTARDPPRFYADEFDSALYSDGANLDLPGAFGLDGTLMDSTVLS